MRRLILLLPALVLTWWLAAHVLLHLESMLTSQGAQIRPHIQPLQGATITLNGGPSLDAVMLNGILAAYHSPLSGHGVDLVALSTRYRVDDAVALAFFVMESRAGTQGEATATHSFGNLRPQPNQAQLDGYRLYANWMDGARDWFQLMRSLYLNTMVEQHYRK